MCDVEELKTKANSGDSRAMLSLAKAYQKGKHIPQDYREAFMWYEKSAGVGHARGAFKLGKFYHRGYGIPQDKQEAMKWYFISAQSGNSLGMYQYARMNEKEDPNLAIEYFEKSAEKGLIRSMNILANYYLKKKGTAQFNFEKGIYFLEKAYQSGDLNAALSLGLAFAKFKNESNQSEYLEWIKKSIEHGNSKAAVLLGKWHLKGKFVEKNYENAFQNFKLATTLKDPKAGWNELGGCYLKGLGTKKDTKMAFKCFQEASNFGHPNAMNNLATCLWRGIGTEKNFELAFSFVKKAANIGCESAKLNLGLIYRNGLGKIGKDHSLAFFWIDQYAKTKRPTSYRHLASLYFEGIGVEKDIQKSFELLRKSIRLGDSKAKLELKQNFLKVPTWYHYPHPEILILLLCIRSFCENSVFYHEFLPLDLFKIIWKESQIGKFCLDIPENEEERK